ncbi:MAG: zinc ribbon domain-containing protein [Prevotella sp.]|jgi:hypothetical protein|nr:zinc ribbon domain-containing protein [Prevotella sp.]MCI2080734.1 zinc ribbon domain-containing protein [Prevotella sp.]MCI2102644.1 zinc ribbon domain-containing protein [Prevotella sp.]
MQNSRSFFHSLGLLLLLVACLASCYNHQTGHQEVITQLSAKQIDSLSFYSSHHYTNNYNFIVKSDSMALIRQQPEEVVMGMQVDSFYVKEHSRLVVADIRMIPNDSVDSVWVELATEQSSFGWVHESSLLPHVVPDDPISQFISTFSDRHVIIFLIVICLIGALYVIRKLLRGNAHIVHFRDIDSFYPTLLALIVASAATFYASIQIFAPEVWRHFYFHPTLNPFSVPTLLSVFLCSVWAMLIVAIAAIDDAFHQLPYGEAVLYLCGLAAVCAIDYLIFSVTTLYYLGYVILAFYFYFSLSQYFVHHRAYYICGNCGAKLHHKGRCPHCGAIND